MNNRTVQQLKYLNSFKESDGEAFTQEEVAQMATATPNKTTTHLKTPAKHFDEATQLYNKSVESLVASLTKLSEKSTECVTVSKKVSGDVKSCANSLKDQLVKLDNLVGNNIEPKIMQLERAAAALTTINEMTKNPKVAEMLKVLK